MKSILARVPVRADLAGGTLDLWPLYLFHPGSRTVNVAISYHAECEVSSTSDPGIELFLTDHDYRRNYDSIAEIGRDPKAALIARALEHFKLGRIRVTTRTDVPRGSGLGGSSALSIALVRALSEFAGEPVEGDELISLVRDLETRLLGSPAGVQDYYPPVYGGLASLHLDPGSITRQPLRMSLGDLAEHLVLHYTGVAHFSGTNNWEIYKRHIDGDEEVRQSLARIGEISAEMERALEGHDLAAAGNALDREWQVRKSLIRGISTPEVDAAISAGVAAGAWGGKVCGAGGGGCVVFLTPPDRRQAVVESLLRVPGHVLEVAPVPYGLVVERDTEKQSAFSFVDRPSRPRQEIIEQLFASGGKGHTRYRPYVLAEGAITFADPHRETHLTVVRTLLAPVSVDDQKIDWDKASHRDPDELQLSAVPEQGRDYAVRPDDQTLMALVNDGEDSFRQYLKESEKLTVYHNAEFSLYSETNETRESFLKRCMEMADSSMEPETDRLERTFRRRIDQMKQKQEREERVLDESEEPIEDSAREVSIAWGQTLYNITSGKPAASDVARSPREGDYLQGISALQRSWDRELDSLREENVGKARQVEEITLTPSRRNIEVRKYVLIWAAGLGGREKGTRPVERKKSPDSTNPRRRGTPL